jgi:hypothetical protein
MHYVFSDDLQGRGKPSIGEIGGWRSSCQDLVLATYLPRPCISYLDLVLANYARPYLTFFIGASTLH